MSGLFIHKLCGWRPPKPTSKWAGALVAAAGVAALGYALAAPLAGSVIGNQATASYRDREGLPRTANSNRVETLITQVGAFRLDENRTSTGGPGRPVEALHTLTNTGNGRTTFTVTLAEATAGAPNFDFVRIYAADANGNADYTKLLCSTPVSGASPDCTTGLTGIGVDPGAANAYRFVAVYGLPASSGTDPAWTPGNTGTVTATATTTGITYTTATTQTNTDTIKVTNAAVFNVTKSIETPSIAGPNGAAWPAAVTSGQRSAASAACPTTWPATGGLVAPAGCTYTVYRLTYTNNGAAAGNLVMRDVIPSGLTFVRRSAMWSGATGTILTEAAAGDPVGIDFEYDSAATEIRATFSNVPTTDSGALYFVVLINNTAQVGMASTTNVAIYSSETCTDRSATSPCMQTKTDGEPFEVLATPGVVAANVSSTVDDVASGGAEDNPLKSGIDLVAVASAPVGSPVSFRVFVRNTGNATDTFDITLSDLAGAAPFPAGTTFTVYRSDGITALIDSSDAGTVIDTGPIGANDAVDILIVANIPNSAPIGTPALPYEALVTARSSSDPTGSASGDDSVWLRLSRLTSSLVDVTNSVAGTPDSAGDNGDIGPGPSTIPTTTKIVQRGQVTSFPLFIANNDTGFNNTYALSASSTRIFPGTLPTGFTVTFHAMPGGACGVNPITSVAVNAGTQVQVLACASVRDTAAIGITNLYFRAATTGTTSTGTQLSDVKLDAVDVQEVDRPEITLEPDRVGEVQEGGSVNFPYTLRNSGTLTCGPFTLGYTGLPSGWSVNVYRDVDNNSVLSTAAGDTLLDLTQPIAALTSGGTFRVIAQIIAPLGVNVGDQANLTFTATDTGTSACGSDSATGTATVTEGQLELTKTQVLDTNCDGVETTFAVTDLTGSPGQCVVYQVIARNRSADPLTNVVINDNLPANTNYENAQQPQTVSPGSGCSAGAAGFSGAATYGTVGVTKVTTVNCGGANALQPNGTVTMRFAIQIDP